MKRNVQHEGIRLNSFAVKKNGVIQGCLYAILTGSTLNCPVVHIFRMVTGAATSY